MEMKLGLRRLIELAKREEEGEGMGNSWMQIVEANHSVFEVKAMGQVFEIVKALFKAIGVDWEVAAKVAEWLKEEGLVEVGEKVWDVELGKRCKDMEIGELGVEAWGLAAKGIAEAARGMGLVGQGKTFGDEWMNGLEERVRRELSDVGGICRVVVAWGKRVGPREIEDMV